MQRGRRPVEEGARVTGLDAGVGGAGRQFDASLSLNPGKGQEEAGDAVGVVMMWIRRFGVGRLRESRVDSGPGISGPEIGAVLIEGRGFEPGMPRVEMPRIEIPGVETVGRGDHERGNRIHDREDGQEPA